jgi:hypothetical protein
LGNASVRVAVATFVLTINKRVFLLLSQRQGGFIMTEKNQNKNDGSVEQENKKAHNKDIEPQRDPVKPQEESKTDK